MLFAGECVDESACPSGNVLGNGRFDRVCVMPAEAVEEVKEESEAEESDDDMGFSLFD